MDHGKILVNDTSAGLKKLIPGGTALEVRAFTAAPDDVKDGVRDTGRRGICERSRA